MSFALEIRQENPAKAFRDLAGPHDPEIAKVIRPSAIRARFGVDRVKNAINCTDLDDDGVLEIYIKDIMLIQQQQVEYFFNALQN